MSILPMDHPACPQESIFNIEWGTWAKYLSPVDQILSHLLRFLILLNPLFVETERSKGFGNHFDSLDRYYTHWSESRLNG